MDILRKLAILADAAKYDASCASGGGTRRNSLSGRGIGSTESMGICHSYAPDGRCISLLKILLTNFCKYECAYSVNRNSSAKPRARFSVEEVVQLTLDFYRRNYIEGLFLSSGVIRDPDYTMEQLVEVARRLRLEHDFRGYIHLKTIPDADGDLGSTAASAVLGGSFRLADRRGEIFRRDRYLVLVTYHPAYVLRLAHGRAKAAAFEALCGDFTLAGKLTSESRLRP